MLLPSAITMFAAGMFTGRLARRFGAKALVVTGCLIGGGGMAILAFAHQQQWEIYLSSALMGVGFGLAFSAMSALVVAAVPASQTGVASGMNANIRTIGGSIGAAAMASIVTAALLPSGLPKESGYTTGFAVMTGALVLAALAGLLIPSAGRSGSRPANRSTPRWPSSPAGPSSATRASDRDGTPCGPVQCRRNRDAATPSAITTASSTLRATCSANPVPTPAWRRSPPGPAWA
jgi:MFS family permease